MAIILGGGRGTRLYPLTKHRAKPALPLAGKYRLIDIPVSNCINSGIQKIYILTQFNSASLNQHITNTYRLSPFADGFVHVLAAQQTLDSPDWFQGTADAVRKSLGMMESWNVDWYVILSGDHLYRMDYRPFVRHHCDTGADVTISVVPVEQSRASSFGLLKTDHHGRVIQFREKPHGAELEEMRVDTTDLGLDPQSAAKSPFIGSMGIYVFSRKTLLEMLKANPVHTDFGKDVIPTAISTHNVQAYLFKGYWEDIGTIESFYHANLQLVEQPNPKFTFFDKDFPIFTRPRFLPPSKILDCQSSEAMICDGCLIRGARIHHSIIGIRSRMEDDAEIDNTLMMGADYYQSPEERAADVAEGISPVGIGANSVIQNAIIDKNVRIGKNVKILKKNRDAHTHVERENYSIINGIVVVTKNSIIADGTVI